jgi:hypothetical protein
MTDDSAVEVDSCALPERRPGEPSLGLGVKAALVVLGGLDSGLATPGAATARRLSAASLGDLGDNRGSAVPNCHRMCPQTGLIFDEHSLALGHYRLDPSGRADPFGTS